MERSEYFCLRFLLFKKKSITCHYSSIRSMRYFIFPLLKYNWVVIPLKIKNGTKLLIDKYLC